LLGSARFFFYLEFQPVIAPELDPKRNGYFVSNMGVLEINKKERADEGTGWGALLSSCLWIVEKNHRV
jgi:hypothetical protein